VVRILFLIPFLVWMVYASQPPAAANAPADLRLVGVFVTGFVALVAVMRLWSRRLARRVNGRSMRRSLRRFGLGMYVARVAVAAWFVAGLYWLSWGPLVLRALMPPEQWPVMLPATIVAIAPAFLAWMGLWWAHYPADRALREQSLLYQLEADLPVHSPPGFRSYFVAQLRLQVLFTVVPILLILAIRDVAFVALRLSRRPPAHGSGGEEFVMLASAVTVFVVAPEVLRRVLHTRTLPDSPLRRRLEEMCGRVGLRYRDILLWQTDNNMGNAAVMGLVPWFRFILLSDLLIETMTDEQIEAVFAHEVGHIVHRHMAWYVVLVIVVMLFVAWLEAFVPGRISSVAFVPAWVRENTGTITDVGSTIGFFVMFGFVSRRFERQADVYAARTMQRQLEQRPVYATASNASVETIATPSYVGAYGASVFNSALLRVAAVNNIPTSPPRPTPPGGTLRQRMTGAIDQLAGVAGNWLHGSIPSRIDYLTHLSSDPSRTARFDRKMLGVYLTLMAALVASAALAWTLRAEVFGM
jgi:STE24 endopeptidase